MKADEGRSPASEPTLIVAAALPPPVGGQSLVNASIVRTLSKVMRVRSVNLSAGRLDRGIQYHARRFVRAISASLRVLAHAGEVLYVSTDSGLGLAYNGLLVLAARIRGMRIVLHHHSFSYISARSRLMRLLKILAGRDAMHVFLCRCMQRQYFDRYGVVVRPVISSNACHLDFGLGQRRTLRSGEPIRVGLLSHLSPEKGLDDFIELVHNCVQGGLPIKAILAGPPVTKLDREKIAGATEKLRGALEFRGPIFGEAKTQFFADIDVFLFPTRFRVEAQPVVLLEAISQGCPFIAFGRGCIADDMPGGGGLVVPASESFCLAAKRQLENWVADPGAYAGASIECLTAFDEQLQDSRRQLDLLVDLVRGKE